MRTGPSTNSKEPVLLRAASVNAGVEGFSEVMDPNGSWLFRRACFGSRFPADRELVKPFPIYEGVRGQANPQAHKSASLPYRMKIPGDQPCGPAMGGGGWTFGEAWAGCATPGCAGADGGTAVAGGTVESRPEARSIASTMRSVSALPS